jgi:ubiquitin C-terminal hydrolase
MSEPSDRSKQKGQQGTGYAMHPYYYQQYYMAQQMANAGYIPVMPSGMSNQQQVATGQYSWPVYPGGYQAGVPMVQTMNGAVPAYYFPYGHPAYFAQYQQQYGYQATTATTDNASVETSKSDSSPLTSDVVASSTEVPATDPPAAPPTAPEHLPIPSRSVSRTSDAPMSRTTTLNRTSSCEGMEPLPLVRKLSKSFSVEKSKWRLSRTGSKPSLALDGTGGDDDEDWDLPASPLMGRRTSLSVSPRPCGNEFLPDEEGPVNVLITEFTKQRIHLVDAIRMFSKELEMPIEPKFAERLETLENALNVRMDVFSGNMIVGDVLGLENPINSKICYLNSVMQVLLPIAPLSQVLSLCLSHGSAGPWTDALARAMRLFFHPPMGASLSLLNVKGMDVVIKELGGLGTQQDVAEALGTVINKLHEESRHVIRNEPWSKISKKQSQHGLDEDSIVYKLFRGVRSLGKQFELFTQLHLAASAGNCRLTDLLAQTLESELHYLPPVLCIELSRHLSENQLTTSQSSVGFSGSMVVPASCCTRDCNKERKYQLVGAVVRSGVYANSGHFWAAQRRADKWYWINDTDVSECPVSQVEQNDASDDLISRRLDAASNWCVLVYSDLDAQIAIHPFH